LPHRIQVFSGGCELCSDVADIVEVGKCKDCQMEVLDVESKENSALMRKYDITAVPSIVIDGKIKVVGKPTFPWFCGDEFYRTLESKYPMKPTEKERSSHTTHRRKLDVMTACGGGVGAALCTLSMVFPVLIGTVGAGASVACSMPAMCGVQLSGVLGTFVNAMAQVVQPLLIVSVALILYGLRMFGRWPLAISGMGGALLYVSMFVLNMSLPLIAAASMILVVGYGFAYLPLRTTG
jgi:hypothetical protein